jgi:Zn-dependent peptidase ImmA (M78 family)
VLAQLRAFSPRRPLRYAESLRIAEHQAYWLLHLASVKEPPVPTDLLLNLPRIDVVVGDQPLISGSAHWSGRRWVIVLNGHERERRQRFVLAHELKHIIDHTTRSYLYTGMPGMTAGEQAERAADYFAGCLLVPRRWLRAACGRGQTTSAVVARAFKVPVPVARGRLGQCGFAPSGEDGSRRSPSAATRCDRALRAERRGV